MDKSGKDSEEFVWIKQVFSDLTEMVRDPDLPEYNQNKSGGQETWIEYKAGSGYMNSAMPGYYDSGFTTYYLRFYCSNYYFVDVRNELDHIEEILSDDGLGMSFKPEKVNVTYGVGSGLRGISSSASGCWKFVVGIFHKTKPKNESKINNFEKFLLKESNNVETNLLIVDVQKSFRKFFSEKYVNYLQKYAGTFNNVYQIWDNHVDGKDVDKDFLYHNDPEIPVHSDLYVFPNQKEIIEKRYNYKVNVDYFKKILDKETLKKIKAGGLKKGNFFPTKEGTIIVYIGNNHTWFHVPKKLYKLFQSLKGKELTIVGGSDSECLDDVLTTAISLGVLAKRDHRYIYSASHCPIK